MCRAPAPTTKLEKSTVALSSGPSGAKIGPMFRVACDCSDMDVERKSRKRKPDFGTGTVRKIPFII